MAKIRNHLNTLQPVQSLTPQQEAFARAYVAHAGNLNKVVDYMGLPNREAALEIYRQNGVGFAIRNEQLRALSNQGATLAVATLIEILENKEEKSKVRLEAAKTVLDRVGISTRISPEAGGKLQRLAEMSIDELETAVEEMKSRAAAMSKPVIEGEAKDISPETGANPAMCEPC